ncbi:MAG: GTP-binding protein [Myxococcota bacterium]
MTEKKPTPINVISGFLGVGKTSAINHLLRHKPDSERWAVLVNEFGEVGIDGALLEENQRADGIEIKELAGGCICCSAGVMFEVSLALLLQNYRPDRLLIEPTGLATLSGIQDTLCRPGFADAVDIRSFIALTDPAHWSDKRYREHEVWLDQVEGADILLANRVDLANPEQLGLFEREAGALFPPKQHIEHIEHGRFDPRLLDWVRRPGDASHSSPDVHGHDHEHGHGHDHDYAHDHSHEHEHEHHTHSHQDEQVQSNGIEHRVRSGDHGETSGWILSPERLFLHERLEAWLEGAKRADGFLRLKGVFRTELGWWAHNVTPNSHEKRRSSHRRDSRIELIFARGSEVPEEGLLECLADELPERPSRLA